MSTGYQKVNVSIGGDQLIMHNGQTADPLNKYAKALKAVTSDKARKKTDEGIVEMGRIECEAGLYLDAKNRVILPTRVLEAHISEGARKTKEGKSALAGMFVDTDGVLAYDGGPLTVAKILDSASIALVGGCRSSESDARASVLPELVNDIPGIDSRRDGYARNVKDVDHERWQFRGHRRLSSAVRPVRFEKVRSG